MSSSIPTVHEASQINVYMKEFSDKLEKLTGKVDKFIDDNVDAHNAIKEDIADIKERTTKIETKMENVQEKIKDLNSSVKDVPLLIQWKNDHQKKCEDIQQGHKRKHDEIIKDIENSAKQHEKTHDDIKKDSKDKNSYIISITAIFISLISIFLR